MSSINRMMKDLAMLTIRFSYRFGIFYIRSRNEFPLILNSLNLKGEGAEIGVWEGDFSDFLLRNWNGKKLNSIDPWKFFDNKDYKDAMNIEQKRFDDVYENTAMKLSEFGSRSQIIRKASKEASETFADEQLDFVYIDAQHHYEAVKEDIELWFPKVKKGGIVAGHDYLNGVRGDTVFGVKKAVDEFAKANKLKLVISNEPDLKSWFIRK